MFKSFRQDGNDLELVDEEQFTIFKDKTEVAIRLGKTKTKKYLVIRAQYDNNNQIDSFQTKLTLNNLKEKSKYFNVASNIDESFILLVNLLEIKEVWVKDILNKNYLKLVFNFQKKDLEINLAYKKNEKNFFFKKSQNAEEQSNKDSNINLNENLNINEIKKDDKIEEKKEEEKIEDKDEDEGKEKNKENEKKEEDINDIDDNIKINEVNENKIEIENEIVENNTHIENKNEIIENSIKKEEEVDNNIINVINNDNDNDKGENIQEKNNENIINEENNKDNKENEKKEEDINDIDDNIKINEINENKIEIENEIVENNINDENKNEIIENGIKKEEEEVDNNIINVINIDNDNDKGENIQVKNNENIINEENNKDNKEGENIIINDNKIEEENSNEQIEKETKKEDNIDHNLDILNNNKDVINSYNVNDLLEKIKNLEEENKKLKEENEELKQKILENDLNKDKLKKSEKEKENLKIELQQLRNTLNQKSNTDNRQNKLFSNESLRQHTVVLPSKNGNKIEEEEKIIFNNIIEDQIIDIEEKIIPKKKKFESKSPINLKIHKTITSSSFLPYSIDNTFDVFTSLKDELLLVYSTKIKSIECFDLVKYKFHKTILNAHNGQILTIRHYCPKYIGKDLILSSSNGDYAVKIWDVETWTCKFNINKIYEKGIMYSVCILFDEYQKESFIFTSSDTDYIKMWSMDEKFIKNISKTNINEKYFIDTYYDNKEYKYYLISGEMRCIKAYELNLNQLFRTYIDNNSYSEHVSAFIYNKGDVTRLVESEFYGTVRIWNFHTGYIIQKIDVCRRTPLVSLCLWNENYLLVSCVDNTIKLVDFKNFALIKSFTGHNNEVCSIKKFIHPAYGECLLSQGLVNEHIKMWING